jgi:O-antigen/teichoic acid export membrane protein
MVGASPDGGPSESGRRPLTGAALETYATAVGGAALSLVNVLIMARALGPSGRGAVAFLTAVAYLSSNLATFGVQESIGNIAGTDRTSRPALATNAALFSLAFGLLTIGVLIAMFVVVPSSKGHASTQLLALTLASIPVLILQLFLRILVQADYRFTITNLGMLVPILLNLLSNGLLAVFDRLTVTSAVCTWIGGQVLTTLILVWYVQARVAGFGAPDRALAQRSLSFGAKSHLGRVMLLGNYRLDVWILGAYKSSTEVGLYSVAVAWAEALFYLPTALATVQRPDLVRMSRSDASRHAARLFRYGLLITAVLAAVLVAAAPILCVGVFGAQFRGSIRQLRVLTLGAFGIVALKQLSSALTTQRMPVRASIGVGIGFLFTVVLDFALIPAHAGFGAALASTIAYTAGGLVAAMVFTRALGARTSELAPRPADVPEFAATVRGALRR